MLTRRDIYKKENEMNMVRLSRIPDARVATEQKK